MRETIDLAVAGGATNKAPWHITVADGEKGPVTMCGLDLEPGGVTVDGVDARAEQTRGRKVCGNCRNRLALEAPAATKEETVAPATDKRKESEPLLEATALGGANIERLRAERVTISNRISGVKTQIKRATAGKNTELRKRAEKRLKELETARAAVNKEIAGRKTPADDMADGAKAAAKTAGQGDSSKAKKEKATAAK